MNSNQNRGFSSGFSSHIGKISNSQKTKTGESGNHTEGFGSEGGFRNSTGGSGRNTWGFSYMCSPSFSIIFLAVIVKKTLDQMLEEELSYFRKYRTVVLESI